MLTTILVSTALLIAVAIAGVLIYASMQPNACRYERSLDIKAPAEKIFALVNDFPSWRSWSPYETKDPAMKRTLSGPTSGKGAVYEWDGDKNVGAGRMEILSANPSQIVIQLDFLRPFAGRNTAEFTFAPSGDATKTTWAMHGTSHFMAKAMSLFINMDKMVGKDFEKGLENLKRLAEKEKGVAPAAS